MLEEILSYPEKADPLEVSHYQKILDEMGIKLVPKGTSEIHGIEVLGKGFTSIVILGEMGGARVALKIQRKDANRKNLKKEAYFLKLLEPFNAAPKLITLRKRILIMEFVDGFRLKDFEFERSHVLRFLRIANTLDKLSIDHSQLQGGKHLLVSKDSKCYIIDFEKAGFRTPRNLTSLVSELFLRSGYERTREIFSYNEERLKKALRGYKEKKNLEVVLRVLG